MPYLKTVRPNPTYENDQLNPHHSYLNRYTKLNYLFDLNRTLALDALTVGNETRYLNHSGENNVLASGGFLKLSP